MELSTFNTVIVTAEPLGVIVATPEEGSTVQATVLPAIEFPLASLGVAVMVVDSVGLSSALLRLSDTLLTVGAGGGFVVPPSPPLPPHAAKELRTRTGMNRTPRI